MAFFNGSSSTSSGSTLTVLHPLQQVCNASSGMADEFMLAISTHVDHMPDTSSAGSILIAAVSPISEIYTPTRILHYISILNL